MLSWKIIHLLNIDALWDKFKIMHSECINYFPSKSINLNSKRKPWISQHISCLSCKKHAATVQFGKIITIPQSLASILQVKERDVKCMSYSVQHLCIFPGRKWAYHKIIYGLISISKEKIPAVFHHYLKKWIIVYRP